MTFASATLGVLGNIGLAIGLVLWYLILTIWLLLQTIYWPVAFLLQPIFFLGRFLVACLLFPVQIIIKFETLYIYFGVAAIVGLSAGLMGRTVFGLLRSVLQLDVESPKPATSGRTLKDWREAKQHRHEQQLLEQQQQAAAAQSDLIPATLAAGPRAVPPPSSLLAIPGYVNAASKNSQTPPATLQQPQRNLLAQTIMEEEDSDFW